MTVLLLPETTGDKLVHDATARAVSAAASLGDVDVLCAGASMAEAAGEAAKIAGVSRVLVAEDEVLDHHLAEPMAALIAGIAAGYEHIVAPATSDYKAILPRLAALLDVMVVSDVIAVVDKETFTRPIYAGNAIQTVKSEDPVKALTVRAAAFTPAGEQSAAPIEALSVSAQAGSSRWIEESAVASDRPELTSAKIVVSGGRALGSKEQFALVTDLADAMGAAVGASRAAVDAGYAPNDWQVGQTGKIVAPDLYIAAGISGAIQHLAGMKDAKVIVAINKDEEAPIFQVADYGLVGDVFTVLPELTAKIRG